MAATEEGTGAFEASGSVMSSVTEHTRTLCELCLRVLPVDGASVVVRSGRDHREMAYATAGIITRLDDPQFVLGEGPCLDAYRCRMPVLEPRLAGASAADRWPGFAREATRAGAEAVVAFPLQVRAVPFVVLEFYRKSEGGLNETDLATALLLVDDIVRVVLRDLTDARLAASTTEAEPLFGSVEIPRPPGWSPGNSRCRSRGQPVLDRRSPPARRSTGANTRGLPTQAPEGAQVPIGRS